MVVDRREFGSFGEHSVIHEPVVSTVNPQGIHIASWVNIGAYSVIEALDPAKGSRVDIADNVYIGHFLRLTAMGEVVIGEEALISDRVYLSDNNHVYDDVTVPIKRQGLREGRRLEIRRGSWIGIGAVVCGGLTIGENAVVAANSVVRSDVPDRTVVAGDPAVVVRQHDGEQWRWTTPPAP